MGMSVGYGAPHARYPGGPNRTAFSADNGTAENAAAGRYTGKIFLRIDNGPYSNWNGSGGHRTTYWTDVNNKTLGAFSAVCWYSGKHLYDMSLAASNTPLGLIVAAVGGSPIEYWIPPIDPTDPLKNPCEIDKPQCDDSGGKIDSVFFEEYIRKIVPYTIGAVLWDQAERDVKCPKSLAAYPCLTRSRHHT